MARKSSDNKTQPTALGPAEFIAGIDNPVRKADAEVLLDWFKEVTGFPADIDMTVLEEVVRHGVSHLQGKYETWPE